MRDLFDLILNVDGRVVIPRSQAKGDGALNVRGDSGLEQRGSEESGDEVMELPVGVAVDLENGVSSHELPNRLGICRHEHVPLVLQYHLVHLRIRRHYHLTSQYVRPEHPPIPALYPYIHTYIIYPTYLLYAHTSKASLSDLNGLVN